MKLIFKAFLENCYKCLVEKKWFIRHVEKQVVLLCSKFFNSKVNVSKEFTFFRHRIYVPCMALYGPRSRQ